MLGLRLLIFFPLFLGLTISPQLEQVLSDPELDYGIMVSVEFSPDGHWLAGGAGNPGGSGVGSLILWDLETGEVARRLWGEYETPFITFPDLYDIAFSPDSRLVAASGESGQAFVWDIETGEQLFRFPALSHPVSFSPDGKLLLTSLNLEIILYDITTGQATHHLGNYTEAVTSAVFNSDGKTILAGDAAGRVILWDLSNSQPLQTFNVGDAVVMLALHPNGKQALIGSGSLDIYTGEGAGRVALWNLETGEEDQVFADDLPLYNGLLKVAFTPDGQVSMASVHNEVLFWSTETMELLARIPKGIYDWESFAISPDGTRIALGSAREMVYIWRIPF